VKSTMGSAQLTTTQILEFGSTWHADATVTTYESGMPRRTAFAHVARNAARLAGGLRTLGVIGDQRVGTLMWNNQEHLEAYLAVPSMGAVLHSANLRLFDDQLIFTINAAQDVVLVVDPDLCTQLTRIAPHLTSIRTVIVNGPAVPEDLDLPSDWDVLTYAQVLSRGTDTFAWPEIDENDAAALCFTTGTTGDPKGVAYSHRSITLQCLSAATTNALGLNASDRALIVVPMFHATAWAYPYAAFWFGADIVLPARDLSADTLVGLLSAEQITFANGVPTIWTAVARRLRERHSALPALSRVVLGGAALPEALLNDFDALGITLLQGWGMTETSPLVTVARPMLDAGTEERRSQSLSQGRVLPGVQLRLTDPETGAVLEADGQTIGELELCGPWITSSYLGGAGQDRFGDGWLKTGDIGTVDRHGYVRLTDRSKDIIKSGGEWISSVDLENTLLAHPDVQEAAVIGVPDTRWDERPCAMIVLDSTTQVDVASLRAWLEGRVAKWWIPEHWSVVAEIPKTSVGKIDKKALRASYQDGDIRLL
jgi:fatty-acyl-CoA synthase